MTIRPCAHEVVLVIRYGKFRFERVRQAGEAFRPYHWHVEQELRPYRDDVVEERLCLMCGENLTPQGGANAASEADPHPALPLKGEEKRHEEDGYVALAKG